MSDQGLRVGIICAIPQELSRLRADLRDSRTVRIGPGPTAQRGRLDDVDVVLVEAGIGKVNTAMTATLLLERAGVEALMFSGVAGGLDPACAIGDVVVADLSLHHDAGVVRERALTPYQSGHVPFLNPTEELGYAPPPSTLAEVARVIPTLALPRLSAAAGGSGPPPRVLMGPILSGDQYISCEDTRLRLHGELGGLAVEMEGAALAQVATAFRVPWLNVRALSDLAGHDSSMDFTAFAEEVAASSATVVRALLPALSRDPAKAPAGNSERLD